MTYRGVRVLVVGESQIIKTHEDRHKAEGGRGENVAWRCTTGGVKSLQSLRRDRGYLQVVGEAPVERRVERDFPPRGLWSFCRILLGRY